ncbi:MAG TPA: hypothetical protein VF784_16640 [Anaerolineales bacterium]
MDTHFWLEMVGYLGSVLVAISLMMRSLLRLRVINSLGCVVFVIYGLLIHAYPVAILNGFIVCINAFYLTRMFRQKDYFQLLQVQEDSAYLNGLLDFYKDEVREIYPDYRHNVQPDRPTWLVLRNMVPAGVFVLQREATQAKVLLDYVIPTYRDFRVARFFYHEKAAYFHGQGIDRFVSAPGRPRHAKYLERMGFRLMNAMYVLELAGGTLKDASI